MRNEVITLIKENLVEIIPELKATPIELDETFVNLGANSVDRGELITLTLERLNLEVSRIEFVSAQTINELADLIIEKTQKV
ncbi:phosphopantetheine-binding protein [Chitinophaga nivalis]|uniref:Phosphopantetheine-binding protein n=1 Tax=Chitinophaga nivalis TaxID=2991709 RepID=A0ABT3IKB3_9BACT|nr:phosphopantetheine-binding protein [Chitinophaga nivalis]MCW3465909.1 phosphopantetheine-binding protein [Chitinophaga nivalis]MCW3484400.1 phosphopantetheine-binding protein [Chitinophaga nivalis]